MASTPPEGESHQVTGVDPGRAQHGARPSAWSARRVGALLGGAAAIAAIGVGSFALVNSPGPVRSTPSSALHITVTPTVPLTEQQLLVLLHRPPDYGPLADPGRRAGCLTGLGYPASTQVLAARPLDVDGRSGVLLILPGAQDGELSAVVVAPNCSAADTGLLAQTSVARPTGP